MTTEKTTENKYVNGKIYKIVNLDESMVYIGSTTQGLARRISEHRQKYRKWLDKMVRKTTVYDIFEQCGVANCRILLIEKCPCSSKIELEKREGEIIKATKCVNKVVTGRTRVEYCDDNKDIILAQRKQYLADNKEKISAQRKQYLADNKEKISAQRKQYRADNRDKILAQRKQYRADNRDKILAQKKQYIADKKK